MKKLTSILAAAAVVFGLASQADAQILYKVEKQGSDKTSYLLGTHHFASPSMIDSIAEMPAILQGVDRLYGEIDMAQMNDPAFMMSMQGKLMAPADSTLDKVLAPAQLDSLSALWNEYSGGIPLNAMYMVKPAVISTQLAAAMAMKVFPELNGIEGIDMLMQKRARELGKPVGGLETMDFQMDMLYGRPISEQATELMKTVSEKDDVESKSIALSKAYAAHDIDKILELMLVMEADDPQAAERMIYARNDSWVKQLAAEMPEEGIMVVVGAGHLPGDRGVIAGLRKAGFTVTPIK